MLFNCHHNSWLIQHTIQVISWFLMFVCFFHKLKVKVSNYSWPHDFRHCLHKCFAQTDSLSTQEWTKGHWVSLLATRSQVVITGRIKSLWNVLLRFNPLISILLEVNHVYRQLISSFEHIRSNLACLSQHKMR